MQANKLNLKSDGHGGWLDARGKFVAKTEDGKLKFVSKREAKAEEDKAKRGSAKPEAAPKPKAAAKSEEQPKAKAKDEGGDSEEMMSDTLTIAFGRFNPPTRRSWKTFECSTESSRRWRPEDLSIRTQDAKKDPLDPDMKISYTERCSLIMRRALLMMMR